MKKIQILLAATFATSLGLGAQAVHADGPGFSVTPTLGANQVKSNVGYFDLLLKPGQSQTMKFTVANSTAASEKIKVSFGTAATSNSGTVDYTPGLIKPDPSLKINLKDYVKYPATVTVPAHSATTVTTSVTMPDQAFKGVIAGGFNFEQADDTSASSSSQKSGVTIINKYRYVVGLVAQNTTDKVAPTLSLGTVQADQVNSRNVISAQLTDSAMAYLTDMNTNATVTKVGDSSVKYTYNNAMMEMAPNSNFKLAIPVSIPGVLNGQTSKPLQAGKYHLTMTVYGGKDTNGQYQTMVSGQVTKYDYKWTFAKDFTIQADKAKTLNAKDPTIDHSSKTNWLMFAGIGIIILLLLIIIFLLLFKRRKDDEKEDNK